MVLQNFTPAPDTREALLTACRAALREQYERTALDEELTEMLEAAIAQAEAEL